MTLRGSPGRIVIKNTRLTISREGFIHRASLLMNSIGEALRKEEDIKVFKAGLRKWVVENIPIKPKTKFQNYLEAGVVCVLNVYQKYLTDEILGSTRKKLNFLNAYGI